jgi:branched-subunit amino acid ABC-type transport system permease component
MWKRPEFENFGAGRLLGKPFGIGFDDRLGMYVVVVTVFLICSLLIVNVKRATAGLVFASMRSSEEASVTTGISVVRAKMLVFAVSAFVAGLGGALYGSTLGSVNPRSFTVVIGIVWLAIVVTWGVRSVIGALLAGMLFAVAPLKLAMILILTLLFVAGGIFTRLLLSKAYRKPAGAIVMALCVIVGAGLSYRMWTKTSDDTAVHIILIALALVIGLLLVRRMLRLETVEKPMRIGLAVAIGVVAIGTAVFLGGLDLAETTVKEVPTMLFGLGAILLAREPRGAVYNMVNRQRLLQIEATERREEQAAVEAELAGVAP